MKWVIHTSFLIRAAVSSSLRFFLPAELRSWNQQHSPGPGCAGISVEEHPHIAVDTNSGAKPTQHTGSQEQVSKIPVGLVWLEMFYLLYFWFPSCIYIPPSLHPASQLTTPNRSPNNGPWIKGELFFIFESCLFKIYLIDYILHQFNNVDMRFSSHKLDGKISPLTPVVKWFVYILTAFCIHFTCSPWSLKLPVWNRVLMNNPW